MHNKKYRFEQESGQRKRNETVYQGDEGAFRSIPGKSHQDASAQRDVRLRNPGCFRYCPVHRKQAPEFDIL